MFRHIPLLTDTNWSDRLPSLTDSPVRVSSISRLDSPISVKGMALKYVLQGNETYFTDNKEHRVRRNQYLLANEQETCHVQINCPAGSTGICIDLQPGYVRDAVYSLVCTNDLDNPDKVLDFLFDEELLQRSKPATAFLDQALRKIYLLSTDTDNSVMLDEVLHDVSYALVTDQRERITGYYRISAVKPVTRREHFRRMERAREILHDRAAEQQIAIAEIARETCLSLFRLQHLFKETYGCSPYYYFLKCKIERALYIRLTDKCTWTEAAYRVGFCDMAAFSKLFKKITGKSPKKAISDKF